MVLLPNAYTVYNCCDSDVTVTINIAGFASTSDYVYTYTGSTVLIGGVLFKTGNCYFIKSVGNSIAFTGPPSTAFTSTNVKACNLTPADVCPECSTVQQYLKFESCCGEDPLYFQIPVDGFYEGLYEYLGTPVSGLKNICYSVTLNDVGVAPILDLTDYSLLPAAPIFTDGVTYSVLSFDNLDCADYVLKCPTCVVPCYTLYNCDGEYFNTTVDLSAYVGTLDPIQIYDVDGTIPGSWYVFLNTGKCNGANNGIAVNDVRPAPCDCKCFTVVTDSGVKGRYIDCDGNIQKIIANTSFCSLVVPLIESAAGPYEVVEGESCIDGECPILCYELVECNTGKILTSQSQGLAQYFISNEVIELVGHPGCWQVNSDAAEDCTCPVDLTVTIVHDDCKTCLGITAYKLTNCENILDIKYTYDDLSQYVDQSVRTDCGCYTVELIDFQPTSTSPIVIISSFANCTECLRIYYELRDCNSLEPSVYTFTDLSVYAGQVINIKGCDTCFTIRETDTPINPGIVTVTNTFEDCISCTPPLPCLCNRMTNYSTEEQEYQYLNCNDIIVNLTLAAGKTSGKICLKTWLLDHPETDNLEIFGECTDLIDPKFTWECPETRPKRKIKPGYSVPTCDIDRWEKITCRSAEIHYKEVMRLRYGLSNCCTDDDTKWLVKKELIDPAALVDPDYICAPVQSCGCAPSSCGCGCSSPLKSCSSQ